MDPYAVNRRKQRKGTVQASRLCVLLAGLALGNAADGGSRVLPSVEVTTYADGRPAAKWRLEARDEGVVLRHGGGPEHCDARGARDVWVWHHGDTYCMHYDGAGPKGWLACLATSRDLVHWTTKGPALDLGKAGEDDSASASYGVTYFDGRQWHMFYMGTPHVTPAPDFIPAFPYLTMKACARSPEGPWQKQPAVTPFRTRPGTYYSATASPGQVIRHGDEYLMFFSASTDHPIKRTLSIVRTKDLNGPWTIASDPIVPPEEQVENTSLFYDDQTKTWFLFTNHVGVEDGLEYTDAIWVYWSLDLTRWNRDHKAVVLDRKNCKWSKHIVGLPSVVRAGNRLAILYDGNASAKMPGGVKSHMDRDVGLAWLDLPLIPPADDSDPIFKGHSLPRLRGAMVSPGIDPESLHVLGQDWKANLIRFQLIRSGRAGQTSAPGQYQYDTWLESELKRLDALLPLCEKYGLLVVVDLHSPPGGKPTAGGYFGSDSGLFSDPQAQEKFVEVWRHIATRYKDAKAIWGYDLANEPVGEDVAEGCDDWQALAERAARAIRAIDPERAIIVEPARWGSPEGLNELVPIPVSNVVYSVHMYLPHAFTHQGVFSSGRAYLYPGLIEGKQWDKAQLERALQPVIAFQERYHVHIYIGEFSAIRWAPDNSAYRYLSDLIDIFEAHGWDWSYHAFREWNGWSVEHGSDRQDTRPTASPTERQQFLCDWFARNQKPGGWPAVDSRVAWEVDRETVARWSAPYRGWHYRPEHIIPAEPRIPGYERFHNTDCPCVYQLPGQTNKWFMSFIAFNGHGYNSFVAESTNLLQWTHPRLAMGFGPPGDFDFGGCVIGAFLYESYDIKAPHLLKRHEGKYWTLYGCYPRQGGYELRPGYEGVACSDDGLTWRRAKNAPILAVQDPDCGAWERDCIYQPWLVGYRGRYCDFYNAANGDTEQTGLAFSTNLLQWTRHSANPVIRNREGGFDAQFASDPKVFRDGDHWTMFYFGVGRGGAHIMAAFSRDLVHWTADAEPLYKAGGNPSGLDRQYAHKVSLVHNPRNDTFYLYYCACGNKGRGIGLITSKPL